MRLQEKPEKWQCLATAFAMAVDMDVREFLEHIGHDGSEIAWSDLPEPECRRAHHIQECIDVLIRHDFSATPVELQPMLVNPKSAKAVIIQFPEPRWADALEAYPPNLRRLLRIIEATAGVVEGAGPSGKRHAVAYSLGTIYDPDGYQYANKPDEYAAHGFFPHVAWIVE